MAAALLDTKVLIDALSQADCLVAAAAVGIGARLATNNVKDFPMEALIVEHWPSEPPS